MDDIIDIQAPRMTGVPTLSKNRAVGEVSSESMVREALHFHTIGLRTRRRRDITAEKYALHIDGEGLSQWLDIFDGSRLQMPLQLTSGQRRQNNQLRPIVDNMVAHLTTKRYRVIAHAASDRQSRASAKVDQALINHTIRQNNWNNQLAHAKYIAAAYGSCPWHAFWRDDLEDEYEAVVVPDPNTGELVEVGARPGRLDNFIGNPWATVYDAGATRYRRHRQTFERVLPAVMVRQAFGREDIEGTDRLSSASIFSRIGQMWEQLHGNHGTAYPGQGESNAELVSLLYDEIPPGVLPDYPDGRLSIYALDGTHSLNDVARRDGRASAKLLWVGALPARDFSSIIVQSHFGRMDDILGKPFVADIDDDQIELNQLETLMSQFIKRANDPPLITSGMINQGTLDYSGNTVLEVEPLGPGNVELRHLELPGSHLPVIEKKITRVLDGMYRKGGWQAASRGEQGGSGKAIIALQTADDSIFGPLTEQTRMEIQDFARLNWKLFKEFGDVPHMLDMVGDELQHLARPLVDREMLSEDAPQFQMVTGFGVSPEAEAQQIINLMNVRDYKGEGVLTAADAKRMWPDQNIFTDAEDPDEVRRRRPRAINRLIQDMAEQMLEQYPNAVNEMGNPQTVQMARLIAMEVDKREGAMMDDDMEAHIDSLSLLTQDTTESPLIRTAAQMRQQQYFQWAAQKQQAQQAGIAPPQASQKPAQGGAPRSPSREGMPEKVDPAAQNSTDAQAMLMRDKQLAKVQPGQRSA